jgi:predicted protein tyrosine phosphatase
MTEQLDTLTLFSLGQSTAINAPIRLRPGNEGDYQRWLFIDEAGTLRSATAAYLSSKLDINARAAGSIPMQSLIPITLQLASWAQTIVFLDAESYENTMTLFTPYAGDKLSIQGKARILDTTNQYFYRQPELISILKEQIPEFSEIT